jgi:hypothetical protein
MSFTDGAKAQDEPTAVLRRTRLVRVPDDARIEQRRCFERVLVKKIRSDQTALRPIQNDMRLQRLFHVCGACFEDLKQVSVTPFEILEDFRELSLGRV